MQSEFAVNLEQRVAGKLIQRPVGRFSTKPEQGVHIEPRDWTRLARTTIDHRSLNFKRNK
jgi:hypothetical protein